MNSIKLITSIVIIAFLCQNIAWANGNDSIAPSSEAKDLVPRYSRKEAVREAGRRIERMEGILGEVRARLRGVKSQEPEEKISSDLRERLLAFFSVEKAEEIIGILKGSIPGVPLQNYLEDMKFNTGQAEEVSQCMDELISNAIDAVLTRYYKKDIKTIGRFGLGALQVFGELIREDELIVLESRQEGTDIVNTFLFYRKNGQIMVKKKWVFAAEYSGGFEEGTSFTIVKNLDRQEIDKRLRRIRDGFCINTGTRIYVNEEQLNNVEGYDYLNCDDFKEINTEVNPVKIRINRYGYQIRDTGIGMNEEEIINNLLSPHTGTKGIKPQTSEERDRETGLFSKGIGTSGQIHVRLNGRLIGYPIPVNAALVSSELHFIFPHSAKILSDWKRLEMDLVAITSFKNLCDKLTSAEPDYARLQCLVCLINEYQPLEERGNIPKPDNLMEYLKKKTAELIRKKSPKYILPNIAGWEGIKVPGGEPVYLSPDIYEFSDSDFSWMERADLSNVKIKEGVRIFLADFKKGVFLNGSNKDGEYLIIDKNVWNQYKDTELLKEFINNIYPFKAVPKLVRLRPYTPILVAVVMALVLILGFYIFKKPEHPSGIEKRPVIEEVVKRDVVQEKEKKPTPPDSLTAANIDSKITIANYPIPKEKSKKVKEPKPKKVLKVHSPGVRIGAEDRFLVGEIFGLGTDGQTRLDKDAEFRPKGRKIDHQLIYMWVVVKPWDVIKLPVGRNGVIDPDSVFFEDEKGVSWELRPLLYGKYVRIPYHLSGQGRIIYWGDIYNEVDIANLDSFPLSEEERIDADGFFGPMLARALGVTNLDEAKEMPDKMKDKAIQRVMNRLFKYDDREGYSWNGRSWSSLAKEKTRDAKRKMGLVCNGTATYYYIMSKILGMDVVLVDTELLENRVLLSDDPGHVLVYVKINGKWRMRDSVEYVRFVHDTKVTGDPESRLMVKYNIPMPNQEMLDAQEFFGPILVKELKAVDLAAARIWPDAKKHEAIRNALKRLFTFTGQSECYWNNRSWSSLARKKTKNGKKKMIIDYSDTKTYYYIMARLLGMDVKLIGETQEVPLSNKPADALKYRDTGGQMQEVSDYDLWESMAKTTIDQPEKLPRWFLDIEDGLNMLGDRIKGWGKRIRSTLDRIDYHLNGLRDEIYGWPREKIHGFTIIFLSVVFINLSIYAIFILAAIKRYYTDNIKRMGKSSIIFIIASGFISITLLDTFLVFGLNLPISLSMGVFAVIVLVFTLLFSGITYPWRFKEINKGEVTKNGDSFIILGDPIRTAYLNGEYVNEYARDGDIYYKGGEPFLWIGSSQRMVDVVRRKWRILKKPRFTRLIQARDNIFAYTEKGEIYRWNNGDMEPWAEKVYEEKPDHGKEEVVEKVVHNDMEFYVIRASIGDGRSSYTVKKILRYTGGVLEYYYPLGDRYKIVCMEDSVYVLASDGIWKFSPNGGKEFVTGNYVELFKYDGHLYAVKKLDNGYELLEDAYIDTELFRQEGLVKTNIGLKEGEEWHVIEQIIVGEDSIIISGLARNKKEKKREVLLRNFKEYSFEDEKVDRMRNRRKRGQFRTIISQLLRQNREWYKRLMDRQTKVYANWSPVHLFTAYIVDRHDISEETIAILEGYLKGAKDSTELVERFMFLVSLIIKYAGDERGRQMISNLIRWRQNDPHQAGIMIDKLLVKLKVDGDNIYAVKGIVNDAIFNKLPEEYQMYVGILDGRDEWLLKEEKDDSTIKGKQVAQMPYDPDRNLADVIYVGRRTKEEIRDLNDLMTKLSNIFPSNPAYEKIMKGMLGSVTAQDLVAMFFIRELVQNSRDEMRTKDTTDKIELRSYLNNNRWIFSVRDPCGMDLDRIVKYLFPPGKTTKKAAGIPDEDLERVFAGVFGWGFYTIFADCSEVCIRTTLNGKGYEMRLRPRYSDEGNRKIVGITLLEAKEYEISPEEHGTVIQRIKYTGEYSLFSIMLEHARAKRLARLYVGAVSNIDTAWVDKREMLSEIRWDNGKRFIRLMTSSQGLERVTVDELYIQEIEEKLLAKIPYPWLKELLHRYNLNLEFDVNTDVTVIRRGLKNPTQYQEWIRDLVYKWIIASYRKGELSIPGLPTYGEFINNPFGPFPMELTELLSFTDGESPSLLKEREQAIKAELPQWIEERRDRLDIRSAINKYTNTNTAREIIRAVVIGVMRGEIILTGKDKEGTEEFTSQLVDAETKIDDDKTQGMLDKEVGINLNTGEYECLMALTDVLIALYSTILEEEDIDRPLEMRWDFKEDTAILGFIEDNEIMNRLALDIINHIPDGERSGYLSRLLNKNNLWLDLRQRIIAKYGKERLKESIDELRGFIEAKRPIAPRILWTVSLQKEDCYKDRLPPVEELSVERLTTSLRENGSLAYLDRLGSWFRNYITIRTFRDLRQRHRQRLTQTAGAYLNGTVPKGTPATLLRYMHNNRIFTDNPQRSKEMARQRGGNDSLRTIQRELKILWAVCLVEGNGRTGYYLPDWLRNTPIENIIRENQELDIPDLTEEQLGAVRLRIAQITKKRRIRDIKSRQKQITEWFMDTIKALQGKINNLPEKIEAVVFDMDGTLIDTEPIYRECFAKAIYCPIKGLTQNTESLEAGMTYYDKNCLGKPEEETIPLLIEKTRVQDPQKTFRTVESYLADYERICSLKIEEILSTDPDSLLMPYAKELIHRLKEMRIPILLSTSNTQERAHNLWSRISIFSLFDEKEIGRNTTEKIDLIKGMLTRRGLNIKNCIFIDDSASSVSKARKITGKELYIIGICPTDKTDNRLREAGANSVVDNLVDVYKGIDKRKIVLVLDTDIGNMRQFEIDGLLKQIKDVSSLFGDIEFVSGPGEELTRLIEKAKRKIRTDNLDVIVVTRKEKKDFDSTYHVTRVDDSRLGDSGSHVPILELLTFAILVNYSDDNVLLGQIYSEITDSELTDEIIARIKTGEFAIPLPPTDKISSDFYNEASEILRSA